MERMKQLQAANENKQRQLEAMREVLIHVQPVLTLMLFFQTQRDAANFFQDNEILFSLQSTASKIHKTEHNEL